MRASCIGSFVKGLWWGAALGAGAALLYAPRPGKETREALSEEGKRLRTKATETWQRGQEAYSKMRGSFESTARRHGFTERAPGDWRGEDVPGTPPGTASGPGP